MLNRQCAGALPPIKVLQNRLFRFAVPPVRHFHMITATTVQSTLDIKLAVFFHGPIPKAGVAKRAAIRGTIYFIFVRLRIGLGMSRHNGVGVLKRSLHQPFRKRPRFPQKPSTEPPSASRRNSNIRSFWSFPTLIKSGSKCYKLRTAFLSVKNLWTSKNVRKYSASTIVNLAEAYINITLPASWWLLSKYCKTSSS